MSILVATDFSPCSRTAMRLAAAIARGKSVPLVVVHAVEVPLVSKDEFPVGRSAMERELMAADQEIMTGEIEALRREGTEVEAVLDLADAVVVIREAMDARRPELVVIGTHGRKGAARFFLGSVAEAVVRKATCPVLVTGETAPDLARWSGRGSLQIAVATDGSPASQAALSWARTFEASGACDLSLLAIYWPSEASRRYGLDDPWAERPRGPELARLVERDVRRDAEAALGRVPSVRLRVAMNDAGDAVADEAALLGVDAVVIGVPRHRPARWAAIVPAAVLRSASVPVLCVPEAAAPALRGLPSTTTILVATDFSEASREAIRPAYGLLRAGGGHVELCTVHVLSPARAAELPPGPPLGAGERAAVEAELRSLIPPEAEAAGITTSVSVVEGTSVPETILATAERLGVDLVAVGSHGRSGFRRAVLGSVADEVARRSPRPVVIVSDRGRQERRLP
jgi:nucleotide-binding universal stress UspA family protein